MSRYYYHLYGDHNYTSEAEFERRYANCCQKCCGEGVIDATIEECKQAIEQADVYLFKNPRRHKFLFGIYRNWKKTGQIRCPDCNF